MDNFFTSLCLLIFLASNNIRASGVVRENQLGNCIITKQQQQQKKPQINKFKRGEMDRRTTTGNELTLVGWKDNKSLYVALDCDSSELMPVKQRWNKDTQTKIAVPQPFLIDQYNKGMWMGQTEPIKILQIIASELKPKSDGRLSLFGFQV